MATHKVKTHRGAKKQGMRHIATGMSRKRKRQLKETGVITGTVAANMRRVMPYA